MNEKYQENDNEKRLRDLPFNLMTLPRWVFLLFIRFYQNVFSPVLPANTCRFYPSCSHYSYQAIYKFGAVRGTFLGIWRLLRCNPFNPGGYDPIPMEIKFPKTARKEI